MKINTLSKIAIAMVCVVATSSFTNFAFAEKTEKKEKAKKKMVYRHAVMFQFTEEATKEQIKAVVDGFKELPKKIDTIIDFEYGTNVSPEKHDKGLTHFFLVTFKDKAGLNVYLPHQAHTDFVKILKPVLKDVTVIDYWAHK